LLVGYVVMAEGIFIQGLQVQTLRPASSDFGAGDRHTFPVMQVLKQRVSRTPRKKKRSNPNQMHLWQGTLNNETAPILRFQCLEQEEENRETSLHAHESGETRIGHRPETVAVEQLPFL
jgi:hypothetical protein